MARSRKYELGVGCLLLGAAVVLAFMALQVGALGNLRGSIDVRARFADAAGLQSGAAVAIAGVEIGTVDGFELDHDAAVVRFRLDPDATVGKDAKVRIRSRSVLGEKYIEIVPGARGAPIVEDGDQLVVIDDQVEIDELVAKLGPLLEAIDPEVVGEVVERVAERLREDPELVDRLFTNADRILANAADASDDFDAFLAEGRATLGQTRGTLQEVDERAEEGREVLARADRILADVEQVSGELPDLVAKVDVTIGRTNELLGTLEESSDQIKLILDNVSEIDKWELRRLLREEGILVRLSRKEVVPESGEEGK